MDLFGGCSSAVVYLGQMEDQCRNYTAFFLCNRLFEFHSRVRLPASCLELLPKSIHAPGH